MILEAILKRPDDLLTARTISAKIVDHSKAGNTLGKID